MISPVCTVNGLAAPQDVAPGSVVTIALQSAQGVGSWSLSCVGTDDLISPASINAGLTVNQAKKTATFTAPSLLGICPVFSSSVGAGSTPGLDSNGVSNPLFTTTFEVNVPTAGGLRVLALGETFEFSSSFGYVPKLNALARATAIAPNKISGLKLWVNGRVGVTNDGTGLCSAWADQSGNGNNFSQGTQASRPNITTNINGKTCLTFSSGSSTVMANSTNWAGICSNASTATMAWTLYAVWLLTSQNGAGASPQQPTILTDSTSPPAIGVTCAVDGSNVDVSTYGNDGAVETAVSVAHGLLANPHYSTHSQSAGVLSAQTDATAVATKSVGTVTLNASALQLGANSQSTNSRFGGSIGEIIVYNRAMTANEDANIKLFLRQQWGLP